MSDAKLIKKIEKLEARIARLEVVQPEPEAEVPIMRVLQIKEMARAMARGDKGPLKAWNQQCKLEMGLAK